jgi:hypothetical protein
MTVNGTLVQKLTHLKTVPGALVRAACDTSVKSHWNDCRWDTSAKMDSLKTVPGAVVRAACDTSVKRHWNDCKWDASTKMDSFKNCELTLVSCQTLSRMKFLQEDEAMQEPNYRLELEAVR